VCVTFVPDLQLESDHVAWFPTSLTLLAEFLFALIADSRCAMSSALDTLFFAAAPLDAVSVAVAETPLMSSREEVKRGKAIEKETSLLSLCNSARH
jgi:hypothetical protein